MVIRWLSPLSPPLPADPTRQAPVPPVPGTAVPAGGAVGPPAPRSPHPVRVSESAPPGPRPPPPLAAPPRGPRPTGPRLRPQTVPVGGGRLRSGDGMRLASGSEWEWESSGVKVSGIGARWEARAALAFARAPSGRQRPEPGLEDGQVLHGNLERIFWEGGTVCTRPRPAQSSHPGASERLATSQGEARR